MTADRYAEGRRYLRKADRVLAPVIDRHPDFDPRAWMRDLPKMDAFGSLLFQVLGQQLSVRATRAMLMKLTEMFGGRLPSPADVLDASPDDLHAAGLSRRKVQTLRALAGQFASGALSDEFFRRSSDEEIESALTAIAGIGPWTVGGFLLIGLGRTDVVPPGDLALRRAVSRLYELGHLPSEQEMMDISEPWRPYRSLAVGYLFAFDHEK